MYRRESDRLGRFLKERCVLAAKSSTQAQRLYEAYIDWCSIAAEKPEANNVFARGLSERGITKKRVRRGVVYHGVGLTPTPASPIQDSDPTKVKNK
jgi:phage/plasmid-associated DNA primase